MVFTEIHQTNNLEVLYKYILHRLYDQEFKDRPQPNQKNSIFIPSGFDSLTLVESLCTGMGLNGKIFEEVIKRPPVLQNAQSKGKPEILTDDWQ